MERAESDGPKIRAIGRQEPSKEALDRFIEIYLDIVAENDRKEKELRRKAIKQGAASGS